MAFKRVKYEDLKPKQQEIYNFQKVAAVLADYGYNCIKLADDWQGADFLAYHKDGNDTLKVQLKGRLGIFKKYQNKDLYTAFPINNSWYVIKHDDLIEKARENTPWLDSDSWKKFGGYDTGRPSKKLLESLSEYKIS